MTPQELTTEFSRHYGQKLPCSVFGFRVLAPLLALGREHWDNPVYRRVQIESTEQPFSNIEELSARVNQDPVQTREAVQEGKWYYCQHWDAGYKSGHSYFVYRTGDLVLVVDSTQSRNSNAWVSRGMPWERPHFRALALT